MQNAERFEIRKRKAILNGIPERLVALPGVGCIDRVISKTRSERSNINYGIRNEISKTEQNNPFPTCA